MIIPPLGSSPLAAALQPNAGLMQGLLHPVQQTAPAPEKVPGYDIALPPLGPLQGTPHLMPDKYGDLGATRPFGPGEYFSNQSGSISSEITMTVTNPELNDSRPTVVPSVWVVNGVPSRVSEDEAAHLAAQSGLTFPSFDTIDKAEDFATKREDKWEAIEPGSEEFSSVPALWSKAK